MLPVLLACKAMATRFEIVLWGDDPVRLRAAGEAALEEIGRLESQLSLYRADSEIARVNARAAREPVRVSPGVFQLLERARRLHQESGGAFDITIAPLVECWGFRDGPGLVPDPETLARARDRTGMQWVELDSANSTVRFKREGVRLDLGAIGKGHAVDQAVLILRQAGLLNALIHGGTSTVAALGRPPEAETWKVAIAGVPGATHPAGSRLMTAAGSDPVAPGLSPPETAALVPLRDEALSVSAVWGKSFQSGGRLFGHILDPRTGQPSTQGLLGAVVLPSATETDALSTALLVLGPGGHRQLARARPDLRTLLLFETDAGLVAEANGIAAA
jgi:FAD:protein FMN transferase